MVNSRKIYKRRRLKKYTKRGGGNVTDIIGAMQSESGAKEREQEFRAVISEDVKDVVMQRKKLTGNQDMKPESGSKDREQEFRAVMSEDVRDVVMQRKKLTGNTTEISIHGIYNFPNTIKKLYVCSDLEGGNNFNLNDSDLVYVSNMNAKVSIKSIETTNSETNIISNSDKKTQVNSIFGSGNDLIVNNGIIDNLKEDVALAYTGDLFDNRPFSFRLLQNIYNLKNNNKEKVIIIGGNRDFNKLRLGIELFLVNSDNRKIFDGTKTLNQLLEADLKFIINEVPNYLDHSDWNMPPPLKKTIFDGIKNDFESQDDDKYTKRVSAIFNSTMGIVFQANEPGSHNIAGIGYKTELKEIFNELTLDDNKVSKLICLLFMAMCFDWKEENLLIKTDPMSAEFNKYKGLLYKYLKLTHPVAYFNLNGKTGLLSHSGMMNITAPLGFKPSERGVNYNTYFPLLQNDLKIMLNQYNNFTQHKNYLSLNHFIRYVAITAPPYSKYSPVTSGPGITNSNSNIKIGGGFYDSNSDLPKNYENSTTSTLRIDKSDGQLITYNIFGHLPNMFFPVTNNIDGTTHVALDICKADFGLTGQPGQPFTGYNNNYSFALLQINSEDDDYILGRTKFGQLRYDITSKLDEKIIYYFNPINDFTKFVPPQNVIDEKIYEPKSLNLSRMLSVTLKDELKIHDTFKNLYFTGKFGKERQVLKYEPEQATSVGGSKKKCMHICGRLCRKCHKHDHHCRIKCHECQEEHCHTRRKKRSKTHKRVKRSRRHRKSRKR